MKLIHVVLFTLACILGVLASGLATAATDKRVNGIITAVDTASVCITTVQGDKVVTGRLDPARTKVLLDGAPARGADLRITYSAKAELGLDDVWLNIQANSAKSFGR